MQRLDCKQNIRVGGWKGGTVLSVLAMGSYHRPGSDSTRAGTEELPFSGLEKKPLVIGAWKEAPLLCVIKLAPTFCLNLQSTSRDPTSVKGKPTDAFAPRLSFTSVWNGSHYNAHHISAPHLPAGGDFM